MQQKLTITVDPSVYAGLHARIGKRNISRFLNDLARPHVVDAELDAAYCAKAADQAQEAEALDWIEGLVGDEHDGPR